MRIEESTALNEEEIMFWLTLKRANTTPILTAVMVPHVVAAWLDSRNVMQLKVWVYTNVFWRFMFSQNGVRSMC